MSRPDAERALSVYKTFGKQTYQVVEYLGLARKYEMSTRLEVPKLKHAPTTLTSSLEDYLNDPNFEVNRRQYLAQQEGKKGGRSMPSAAAKSTPIDKEVKRDVSFPTSTSITAKAPVTQQPKASAPDLMDFFESIEQNQQPMAHQNAPQQQFNNGGSFPQVQQYQQPVQQPAPQTGYNPFLPQGGPDYGQIQQQQQQPQPLQPDFTGAGFGGYTPQFTQQSLQSQPFQSALQSIPQQSPLQVTVPNGANLSTPQNGNLDFQPPSHMQTTVQSPAQLLQPQQTSSNPFRQSMMPTGTAASALSPTALNRQSTNPFARNAIGPPPSQQQPPPTFSFDNTHNSPSTSSPFTSPPPQSQHSEFQANSSIFASPTSDPPSTSQTSSASQLQPHMTGTNPFARNLQPASQPAAAPLVANATGSTNPFRQSAFVNQQTGTGWQNSGQGTFAGFDVNSVNTMPIFPRPGQS